MAQFASKPHADVSYHGTWSWDCRIPNEQRPNGDGRDEFLACEECDGTFVNPILHAARDGYDPTDAFAWAVRWAAGIMYAECEIPGEDDTYPHRVVHMLLQPNGEYPFPHATAEHMAHALSVFNRIASMSGGVA